MPGVVVDGAEEIVKHANALNVQGDRVDGVALLPRPQDDDGSSVNRLVVFGSDTEQAMTRIRECSRLKLKASHRYFQVNVRDLSQALQAVCTISVIADPLPADLVYPCDPSHALINGLPKKGIMDDFIGDLIRQQIKRVYKAVI